MPVHSKTHTWLSMLSQSIAFASLSLLAQETSAVPVLVPFFDVVFLLDESGSISLTEFQQEKDFAIASANALSFGPNYVAASLVLHGSSARVGINLTQSRPSFVNAVNAAVPVGGSSDFTAALVAAENQFDSFGRPGASKIVAIVGDGPANLNVAGLAPKLDELASEGIHIYSIMVVPGDMNFMQGLVRNGGQFFTLTAFGSTATAFVQSFPIPGDFDLDRDVDGFDFLKWQRGESPTPLSASDLADWETNYGIVFPLVAAATAVPEPSTGLALLFTLTMGGLHVALRRARGVDSDAGSRVRR